jgi:3-methyladenine DNA glycosylase AlkC
VNETPTALKEILFNPELIAGFARAIQAAYPVFDREAFQSAVLDAGWEGRALMARLRHVTVCLRHYLPDDYRAALDALLRAAPALPGEGFITMVPSDFVAVYGLDDPDASIPALELFTQASSAEFAVRPFIVRYPERMMAQMLAWAGHEHPGVRRLASEGCRPRLPWGIRLQALVADPRPILPILEKLKYDESESVRRSVANNLNDISKDHPGLTLQVLGRWLAEEPGDMRINWIAGHALRTLVKAGDPGALVLLGFPSEPQIEVSRVRVEPQVVPLGGSVTLTYEIRSTADSPQELILDYIVHHMRANGRLSPKVFKHRKVTLEPGQSLLVEKRHRLQPVTTRRYYPGRHAIQPQVNGRAYELVDFELAE